MAYSIVKKTWKCDKNFSKIGDEIEIIESHDRYMKATVHFKEMTQSIRDSMNGKITVNEYNLGDDRVYTINGEYEIVDIIFTDARDVIKYL